MFVKDETGCGDSIIFIDKHMQLWSIGLYGYTFTINLLFIRVNLRSFILSSWNRSSGLVERNVQRESVVAGVLRETSVIKK